MPAKFDDKQWDVLDKGIFMMAKFKSTFRCELKPDVIAELCVVHELNLELMDGPYALGYDAAVSSG
jgi:hypothetical protein